MLVVQQAGSALYFHLHKHLLYKAFHDPLYVQMTKSSLISKTQSFSCLSLHPSGAKILSNITFNISQHLILIN